jgi:prevent-host-death family protein
MPIKINIYEAKTKFSKLIKQAMAGQEIIIAKSGKPVAKLIPFGERATERIPGSAKGKILIGDEFEAPLPKELLEAFSE